VCYESENTFQTDDGVDSFVFARIAHSYGDDERLDHLAHIPDFDQAKEWLRERTPRGFLVVDTIQGSVDAKDHDGALDADALAMAKRHASGNFLAHLDH
jgi:hypothetical protein